MTSIYEKYCSGARITNEELLTAIADYQQAADATSKLGIAFNVTFKEINRVYMSLADIGSSRGIYKIQLY